MVRRLCSEWFLAYASIGFPILYVAAYFAMMNPQEIDLCSCGGNYHAWRRAPNYRWRPSVSETLFFPLHFADAKIRPQYWWGIEQFDDIDVVELENTDLRGFGDEISISTEPTLKE